MSLRSWADVKASPATVEIDPVNPNAGFLRVDQIIAINGSVAVIVSTPQEAEEVMAGMEAPVRPDVPASEPSPSVKELFYGD